MTAAAFGVLVEAGGRRTFAVAADWPGWCRAGREEAAALEALAAAAPRYRAVAAAAGIPFDADPVPAFEVVDRAEGNASTDFGVPGAIFPADHGDLDVAERERSAALLAAAWAALDAVASTAPASLRKGPRGGGRDRDAVVAHVAGAEVAYARKIGLRLTRPAPGADPAPGAVRAAALEVLRGTRDPDVEPGWPLRYAARRFTWHVLDHVWEIEDRSG
jgi:hypothetical protein